MTLTLARTGGNTYYFNTTTTLELSRDYNVINVTLPGGKSSDSIVTSLLGVTAVFDITFQITPRAVGSQSYDGSTVAGSATNVEDEVLYLWDDICDDSGVNYTLSSSFLNSSSWYVTIASINLPIVSEQPVRVTGKIQLYEHANV